MNTKLTLTIEKAVIEKAKEYAKNSGRSLSDLIESYLDRLVSTKPEIEEEVPDEFKELFGCVEFPADMNDKEAIRTLLSEKHK